MKKSLIALALFSLSVAEATLPRIYLCSRLTREAREWNDVITEELDQRFSLFRPQDIDLENVPTNSIDCAAYHADFTGLLESDLLLVLPPYGRDCAWEIGWCCGQGKPAIAYAETEEEWLRDAMVKGGLTAILTNNPLLYAKLSSDPGIGTKSYLIPSRNDLGKTIELLYNQGQ